MNANIQLGSMIQFTCRKGLVRKGEVESVENKGGRDLITIYVHGVGYRNFYRDEIKNLKFVTE